MEQYCLRRFKKPLFFRAKDFSKNYIIYWYFVSKIQKLTIRFGLGQSQKAQQKELHRSSILRSVELWVFRLIYGLFIRKFADVANAEVCTQVNNYIHSMIIYILTNCKVMIWCGFISLSAPLLVLLDRWKTLYYHHIITLWFTEVVKDHAEMVSSSGGTVLSKNPLS